MKDQIFVQSNPRGWNSHLILNRIIKALRKKKRLADNRAVVLNVTFVGTAQIKKLNLKFRKKNKATDVLSFEQVNQGASNGPIFLGDLVLCVPVVRQQAREFAHGVRQELAVLLVHGMLHLLGFDHEKSVREQKKMRRVESEVLTLIGVKQDSSGLISRSEL